MLCAGDERGSKNQLVPPSIVKATEPELPMEARQSEVDEQEISVRGLLVSVLKV